MILVVFVKVVIKTYVVFYINVKNVTLIYVKNECEDQKYKNHEHNFIKIRKKKEKKKIGDKVDKKKMKM